jgi:hypothetical protein
VVNLFVDDVRALGDEVASGPRVAECCAGLGAVVSGMAEVCVNVVVVDG